MGCGQSTNTEKRQRHLKGDGYGVMTKNSAPCVVFQANTVPVYYDNKPYRPEGSYNPKKINAQKIPDNIVTEYQENTTNEPIEFKEVLGGNMAKKVNKAIYWEIKNGECNEDPQDELEMEDSDVEDEENPEAEYHINLMAQYFVTLDDDEPGVKKSTNIDFPNDEEKASGKKFSEPESKVKMTTNMMASYIRHISTDKDAYSKKEFELSKEKQEKVKKDFSIQQQKYSQSKVAKAESERKKNMMKNHAKLLSLTTYWSGYEMTDKVKDQEKTLRENQRAMWNEQKTKKIAEQQKNDSWFIHYNENWKAKVKIDDQTSMKTLNECSFNFSPD